MFFTGILSFYEQQWTVVADEIKNVAHGTQIINSTVLSNIIVALPSWMLFKKNKKKISIIKVYMSVLIGFCADS